MPTTSTLLIAKAVDAVVALARAIPTTGDLAALTVFDGPGNNLEGNVSLWIGCADPSDPTAPDAGSSQRNWAQLGRFTQDDRSVIPCLAVSWSGDDGQDGFSVNRLRAAAAIDALVDAIRAAQPNPWLGVPGLLYGSVDSVSLLQASTDKGSEVYVPFTISYRARG